MCEHSGRSHRTNRPLSNPSHSKIREHSRPSDIEHANFSILGSSNLLNLRILEYLHIAKNNPSLNYKNSAYSLNLYKI